MKNFSTARQIRSENFAKAMTDALELLNKDEVNERAVVRCLFEFGLKEWEARKNCCRLSFV